MKHETRESWLIEAIKFLSEGLFKRHGQSVPQVRVSVGLPYGRGSKKIIGQHWHPKASDDQVGSIFISPTIVDGQIVLGTLVHEMVHATVGNEAKHGPAFKKVAVAVGLAGQMRSTSVGPELKAYLDGLLNALGPYPHAKLNILDSPIKKQSSRMIKMCCPECGYIARASMSAILNYGPVLCPCNAEPMHISEPNEP